MDHVNKRPIAFLHIGKKRDSKIAFLTDFKQFITTLRIRKL